MKNVKPGKNFIFMKNGKNIKIAEMVQESLEIFSRSQMTKQTSSLDLSRKIYLSRKFSSNSEIVGFFHNFRGNGRLVTLRDEIFMRISRVRK